MNKDEVNMTTPDYHVVKLPFCDTLFHSVTPLCNTIRTTEDKKERKEAYFSLVRNIRKYMKALDETAQYLNRNRNLLKYNYIIYYYLFSTVDDKLIETPLGKVGETESFFFNRLLDSQLYTIQKKGTFLNMLSKSKLFQKKPKAWSEKPDADDDIGNFTPDMTMTFNSPQADIMKSIYLYIIIISYTIWYGYITKRMGRVIKI